MWQCLIIEDDHENARYIASGFARLGHSTVLCHDGEEGMQRATQQQWDVIILDRMLPNNIDGLSILEAMRQAGKKTPVLVLSALAALDERVKGLKAGGDDYLTKPFAFSELTARAEALVRRSRAVPSLRDLKVGDLTLDLLRRRATRAGKVIALQPREFKLLAYFMMHADQLVTRTMLLQSVWEYNFDPQTNVIDVQVSRLRNKIDAGFDFPLIHTVRGSGYIFSAKDVVTVATMSA